MNVKNADGGLFTREERVRARNIILHTDTSKTVVRLVEEVIKPAMPRINQATGQENDERYMAYLLYASLLGLDEV